MKPMRPGAPTTAVLPTMPIKPAALPAFLCCDCCPGPAGVSVQLSNGGELVLCRNHARQHDAALFAQGAVLVGDYSLDGELVQRQEHRDEAPDGVDPAAGASRKSWWRWLRPRRDAVRPLPSLHPETER